MHNSLTDISLQQCVQTSLQLDVEKSKKKRQKLTIESVRQHIESFGYKLTSTTYKNNETKLDISCLAGHRYSVSYNHFQRGIRCAECVGNAKFTIEAVRQYIESFGYQLLSTEYLSNKKKLDILCPKDHLYKVTYCAFQQGRRCAVCHGNAKHRLSNVKRHIESFGYRLRSNTYVSAHAKLEIICPKSHTYFATYSNFQKGNRCPECSGKKKHTIDAVKRYVESFEGYQLRSTVYVGGNAKLDILCPVGHNYKVVYGNFQQGSRCPECAGIAKRRTMKNGEEWEPRIRNSTDDQAWRKAVKKRDGQICQACFYPSKNLCAHHIESYSKNPELRTDLNNGVALCESCHTALHSQYGRMTATRADLAEFTRLKCR